MSPWFYILSTLAVFIFSGLLAMAGLGAAFVAVRWFKVDILWVFVGGLAMWTGLMALGWV